MTTVLEKFDISALAEVPRGKRLDHVRTNEPQLHILSSDELNRVGTLLLPESSREMKLRYPVETDSKRDFDMLLPQNGENIG